MNDRRKQKATDNNRYRELKAKMAADKNSKMKTLIKRDDSHQLRKESEWMNEWMKNIGPDNIETETWKIIMKTDLNCLHRRSTQYMTPRLSLWRGIISG